MLFNSLQFFLFFIVVTVLYYTLEWRWRWKMLLAASCVFYMAFIPAYIFILFTTILIDYVMGFMIAQSSTRVEEKVEEAGLTAAVRSPNIEVVDFARQRGQPVAPDLPVYLAIPLFVALWLAIGGALLLESRNPAAGRTVVSIMLTQLLTCTMVRAQAPTPST
jgi:D-alanyl-lipoteichoic acid acyltransferase DltB (MBOAT superfamily)